MLALFLCTLSDCRQCRRVGRRLPCAVDNVTHLSVVILTYMLSLFAHYLIADSAAAWAADHRVLLTVVILGLFNLKCLILLMWCLSKEARTTRVGYNGG